MIILFCAITHSRSNHTCTDQLDWIIHVHLFVLRACDLYSVRKKRGEKQPNFSPSSSRSLAKTSKDDIRGQSSVHCTTATPGSIPSSQRSATSQHAIRRPSLSWLFKTANVGRASDIFSLYEPGRFPFHPPPLHPHIRSEVWSGHALRCHASSRGAREYAVAVCTG